MMSDNNLYSRYQRQIILKEFGVEAQEKLHHAKVLVIGAGGLGCPAIQYLAAAGVGTIGIVDFDTVELSNLQRQTLFNVEDVGEQKVLIAAKKMHAFNPEISIHTHQIKLNNKNAYNLISNYNIVLDGTDNFATKYVINDVCMMLNKPLVYAAILGFEGQLAVFNLPNKTTQTAISYRDLFPNPPNPDNVPTCNQAGVIGVLPGIIGTMQAAEAIKIITGIGNVLNNSIVSYNVLYNQLYNFEILPNNNTNIVFPKSKTELENYNYDWHCEHKNAEDEIVFDAFEKLKNNNDITIIDVREIGELPIVNEFNFIPIPLSNFETEINNFKLTKNVVLFCQQGKRSLKALKILKDKFNTIQAYSLKGGIEEWKKNYDLMQLKK